MTTRALEAHASGKYSKNRSPKSRPSGTDGPVHSSNYISKPRAAEFLGISLSEFKRREKAGIYVSSHTAESGRRLYDVSYLECRKTEVPKRIPRSDLVPVNAVSATPIVSKNAYAPEIAAEVFQELAVDEDLIRIVVKLKLHPSIVEAVHADWVKLRTKNGGFYVSGTAAKAIDALELDGFPVSNGEELATALECIASSEKPCAACQKRPRRPTTLCGACEREAMKV